MTETTRGFSEAVVLVPITKTNEELAEKVRVETTQLLKQMRVADTRSVTALRSALLSGLLHGDEDHQEWLTRAIDAILAGEKPPEPYGRGRKEALLLDKVIGIVAGETLSFHHTVGILKKMRDAFSLKGESIVDSVAKAGFFKDEGIKRLAKEFGVKRE